MYLWSYRHAFAWFWGLTFISVGPLCIGVISTWLSILGDARHRHTVPSGWGTMTVLLYHLAIFSAPSSASIWCFCNLFSSLKMALIVHMLHASAAPYMDAMLFLTCKEKYSFEGPHSCKYMTIFIMYYKCPVSALCCFVGFHARTCYKLIYFLFNLFISGQIIL